MPEGISWQKRLEAQLPLLGHRNWIVVADWAYPWQTAPGVETIFTGAGQIEVVKAVLDAIDRAPHVRPITYVDAELPFLSNDDAEGIDGYRDDLKAALAGRAVRELPHDEIIAKLDAAGRAFHILLLKTTLTLPYTSVFLELDCGYWSAEEEQRLRKAFKA